MEKEADASLPLFPYKRLSLWESWRGAPERARMLTKNRERDDSIALTKGLLIAAQRLFRAGLALSVTFGATARVAAPSIRCALLASCWPRPQQLLPVSAAGGGRRRCSQRERLWQVGPLPTGRLRRNMAQKGGPCCRGQRLLDKRTLSSCRWPGQQGTTVHETDKPCSSRGNLTDMPRALPLGELARRA